MDDRAISGSEHAPEYIFRFDAPLRRVVFGSEVALHGWLFHREGKPIHGVRALVRRRFFGQEDVRGRRKRNRPDAAAAYPEMADAATSGFLFELKLHLGRSEITFQLLDHVRKWQTFATASVTAVPLSSLARLGLTNTRTFALAYLRKRYAPAPEGPASAGPERGENRPSEILSHPRIDLFATSKSNLFMIEIGELVAAGFRELGCEATLHLDRIPLENPPNGTMQFVVAPHEYHHLFLTEKLSRERAVALTRNVYLLCTEQPETGWFQSSLQWAQYSLGVADINPLGVVAYRAHGLPAQQLALGYHPMLAHPLPVAHAERRYDLSFLGAMTDRREEFIARHADFFVRRQCHLRLVPLGFAKTAESRSYLSSERRNELLIQSRILLNLHHSEQRYFEWHRLLVGLANGCCIISETCQGYGPLVPGKHFVMVEREDLIIACEYYLEHADECARIAAAGKVFVETELRQAQTCAAFLRGSASNADAAPVPLSSELRRRMSRNARRLLAGAIREDLRARHENVAVPEAIAPEARRAAVVQNRAGYRERLAAQQQARAQGAPVWELHENEAFARSSAPQLSVLITLYNYAEHIEACVASATAAAARLAQAPEIVIVNDASTDNSLGRALRCLRDSQLPMRVVDKRFNTGLADARNTALELARAPYIFMMDADNLIFPDGLRQLLALISDSDYAAAYSMLARFRGRPENRVGLLSYFDWDPQVLVQYPYVDAMAMFQRDTLLRLGGYDSELSQIGWFGWEDYEMWLRFAQRDLPVAFIPNTLCLYRDHERSMLKTTNLFQSELVHHFVERFGDLVARFEPRESLFGMERAKIAGLTSS